MVENSKAWKLKEEENEMVKQKDHTNWATQWEEKN